LPALADRVRGDLGDRHALAGLPRPPSAPGGPRVPEARPPVRRAEAVTGGHDQVSRVLSGVALLVVAGSAIWLAPSSWLLGLAVLVAVLGAVEYGRLCRHLHAPVPVVPVVVLTAMACAAM